MARQQNSLDWICDGCEKGLAVTEGWNCERCPDKDLCNKCYGNEVIVQQLHCSSHAWKRRIDGLRENGPDRPEQRKLAVLYPPTQPSLLPGLDVPVNERTPTPPPLPEGMPGSLTVLHKILTSLDRANRHQMAEYAAFKAKTAAITAFEEKHYRAVDRQYFQDHLKKDMEEEVYEDELATLPEDSKGLRSEKMPELLGEDSPGRVSSRVGRERCLRIAEKWIRKMPAWVNVDVAQGCAIKPVAEEWVQLAREKSGVEITEEAVATAT